jgi:hypothetical protein
MKTFDRNQHVAASAGAQEPRIRGGARKFLLTVLASSAFLVAAQTGLSTVEHAGLASLQILLDVCQVSLAAIQIFAR